MSVSFSKVFRSNIFYVFVIFIGLTLVTSVVVYLFERRSNPEEYRNLWDSFWWVLVTVFTVGYGDIKPETTGGRVVAILVMFAGISLLSLITATVSSIFVARRIREGQGLEKVKVEDHIIICGWYDRAERILESIFRVAGDSFPKVVLVNELTPEEVTSVVTRFEKEGVKYIRGDFTKVVTLEKANLKKARMVILLPNLSKTDRVDADEKTILATLNIKSVSPKVKVLACILDPENESHVRRAKADYVFVSDQFSDFIIANQVSNPVMLEVFRGLLSMDSGKRICVEAIPARFVGKMYREVFEFFRKERRALPLGLVSQSEPISLSDFLSADTSFLDAFIEKKLKQAGKSLEEEEKVMVNLNPDDDYVIKRGEQVIVLR